MARTQSGELLKTLQAGFKYIENESFQSTFQGLFSEINLGSDKLGKTYADRNTSSVRCHQRNRRGFGRVLDRHDTLGDAYEYLIGQFAAGSGKKAGEFYTPQQISSILSAIVTLDSQEPEDRQEEKAGQRVRLRLRVGLAAAERPQAHGAARHRKIFGQEKNITTYNLARMNMLLHGVKDSEFEIYHGDTLKNDWDMLRETNPRKKPAFDAVVANPPFSYRWEPGEAMGEDVRFKNYGLAPKSAADFAFLLHGFHYLKDEGVMAIILPHGVLFRGGAEEKIRTKLLKDGHIDTVIGLPANLFYSTGIPVCILVLKKCKKPDDVLFINASEHFEGQAPESADDGAHREDHRDVPAPQGGGSIRPPGGDEGDRGQRLQPETSAPLRGRPSWSSRAPGCDGQAQRVPEGTGVAAAAVGVLGLPTVHSVQLRLVAGWAWTPSKRRRDPACPSPSRSEVFSNPSAYRAMTPSESNAARDCGAAASTRLFR
jgi:type I restriction system adenine methylase HsdM